MLASCSYALPLARTLSWCIVCATAHLPNVVLVGACGPALSELVGSSENRWFACAANPVRPNEICDGTVKADFLHVEPKTEPV